MIGLSNDDTKVGLENMTAPAGLKKCVEAAGPKGKRCSLPWPGDGLMDDVGGALTLPGVRKIRCDVAAR